MCVCLCVLLQLSLLCEHRGTNEPIVNEAGRGVANERSKTGERGARRKRGEIEKRLRERESGKKRETETLPHTHT